MSAHLDETRIDQNTRAEGVEDAADDVGRRAVRIVRRTNAETDSDTWSPKEIHIR